MTAPVTGTSIFQPPPPFTPPPPPPKPLPSRDTIETMRVGRCCIGACALIDMITYPFRSILCVLAYFTVCQWILLPLDWMYGKIIQVFDAIYYWIAKRYETPQLPFSQQQLNKMQGNYWGLKSEKWKEGVESFLHHHGPYVFDRGAGVTAAIEFGFHRNWERGAHFLSHQFQNQVDAEMYLRLHRITCSHFLGQTNGTLMGGKKVGAFRDSTDFGIAWVCRAQDYPVILEAEQQLAALNAEIKERFGVTLVSLVKQADGTTIFNYTVLPQEKIKAIYNYFAVNLYAELERAKTPDEKLIAVCTFFRNCEWLHPVQDGCGRCDLMILNFLLTQQGFHPVIMERPYLASTVPLLAWVDYVRQGLKEWEKMVSKRVSRN